MLRKTNFDEQISETNNSEIMKTQPFRKVIIITKQSRSFDHLQKPAMANMAADYKSLADRLRTANGRRTAINSMNRKNYQPFISEDAEKGWKTSKILSPCFPPAPGGRIMPHDASMDFVTSKGPILRGKNFAASDYGSEG